MTELKPTLSATSSCNFLSYSENRSSFSISPIIPSLFYRNSDLVSPQPSSNSKLLTKRKNLLEMMGYPIAKPSICKSISPDIDLKSKKISLTDFMGSRKSNFLKQSGFIDIDELCLKLRHKKMLETSGKNQNPDLKKEKTRNMSIERNQNANLINSKQAIVKEKIDSGPKLTRIKHCEDIIKMCNEMNSHAKTQRAPSCLENRVPKRNAKKRLSHVERNSIIKEIYKL